MRVVIVGGAGGVGASVAFNLLQHGGHDVVLIDRSPEMTVSHVMDLEQTLVQGFGRTVRGGDSADMQGADVIVVTAAAPLTVNTSRLVYLNDNAAIVRDVVDALPASWPGVLVVVTNPVDPLVTWAQRHTGLDRHRVIGYTLNDSLRLRSGVARVRGAAPGAVGAWVVGEHGDACVPLWGTVEIDGRPVVLDAGERARAEDFLRTWYVRHVALDSGRSSTWTSGVGVARMVCALDSQAGELWPCSLLLDGEYGLEDVALSVPVILAAGGVREVQEWQLDDGEQAGMRAAADLVRTVTDSIDLDASVVEAAP